MTPRCTQLPLGPAAKAATRHRGVLPRIGTARLVLRAPEAADLPLWTALCTGPDSANLGGPMSDREAWHSFTTYVAGWLLHGHGLWSITTRSDDALIGFVMLGLEWEDLEPELGFMLAPEARGQGYALEATEAARDHGLGLFGPGGFVSYVNAGNAPSNRVAGKLGAQRDLATEYRLKDTHVWRHGTPAQGTPA